MNISASLKMKKNTDRTNYTGQHFIILLGASLAAIIVVACGFSLFSFGDKAFGVTNYSDFFIMVWAFIIFGYSLSGIFLLLIYFPLSRSLWRKNGKLIDFISLSTSIAFILGMIPFIISGFFFILIIFMSAGTLTGMFQYYLLLRLCTEEKEAIEQA